MSDEVDAILKKLADIDKVTGRVSIGVGIEENNILICFPEPKDKVYLVKKNAIEIAHAILAMAEKIPDEH